MEYPRAKKGLVVKIKGKKYVFGEYAVTRFNTIATLAESRYTRKIAVFRHIVVLNEGTVVDLNPLVRPFRFRVLVSAVRRAQRAEWWANTLKKLKKLKK